MILSLDGLAVLRLNTTGLLFGQTQHDLSMRFFADLHVYSKYSRPTSRDLNVQHLALWAGMKAVAVVATGDFTYPAWLAELEDRRAPPEPGLFRLPARLGSTARPFVSASRGGRNRRFTARASQAAVDRFVRAVSARVRGRLSSKTAA